MKYAFLLFTYLVCSATSIWGTLHFAPQASATRLLEAEGQKEWPYYSDYRGSYSESAGVPINRAVAMSLGGNISLGVKEKADIDLRTDNRFKQDAYEFALATLKYPKAPLYVAQLDSGHIMLCLGDYGNLAASLTIGRISK